HFEKMAYDNGVLLDTFARAAAAYDNEFFRSVVAGILQHYVDVSPQLLEAGGFPGSQDADFSSEDDGDYWTWTAQEIRDALHSDAAASAVIAMYGLDDRGGAMHNDPNRHVLFLAKNVDAVAASLDLERSQIETLLEGAKLTLKRVRDARPRPFVDETLYSGWVSLVASGHLAAARWTGETVAAGRARRALERMFADAFRPGIGLLHRFGDADSGVLLEDQAHAALACLDAAEVLREDVWLRRAGDLIAIMNARFRDDSGAYCDRPLDAPVIARPLGSAQRPITDAPTPSGNGSAALALMRYAALTGDNGAAEQGRVVLRAFGKAAERLTSAAATYLKALAWMTEPVTMVVIVGQSRTTAGQSLHAVALSEYRPRTAIRWLDADRVDGATLPPELAAMVSAEPGRAYVCVGKACSAPVTDPAELRRVIREFRG
ncbi:MAG: hypothetical protein ABIV28_07570, partial [Longimicrobiales bacterium]